MRTHAVTSWLILAVAVSAVACAREESSNDLSDPVEATRLEQEIALLEELGYVSASRRAGEFSNVTVYDSLRASPGLNLYVSGHAPEAILMDMEGRVLHRWRNDSKILARRRVGLDPLLENVLTKSERRYWRRVHLALNGDLLAIHSLYSLIKLDRDSNLLWEYPKRVHHDFEVLADGTIYVLVADSRRLIRINPERDVEEDFVAILAPDGRELRRVSLLEAIENAGLNDLVAMLPVEGDLLHTNSLRVLDGRFAGRNPAFRAGNVLVSFLTLNTIAVVDLDAEEVVWSLQGSFRFQHDPRLVDDGSILLFDNLGPALRGKRLDRHPGSLKKLWYGYIFGLAKLDAPASAVLEIDPETGEVLWSYEGTSVAPFNSVHLGASHRLPNGNTLIVESEPGRVFEVTPIGEIVWEFVSPHRLGDLVAHVFDLVRIPPDFPVDWAQQQPGRPPRVPVGN